MKGNRWQMSDFNIQTPIGRGTIVGMTPDHTRVLVMHTRIEDDETGKKGSTHALWWSYDEEKGAIVVNEDNSSKKE